MQWDVVTINFGLHDCDPGGDVKSYTANLETILKKAQAASEKVRVRVRVRVRVQFATHRRADE